MSKIVLTLESPKSQKQIEDQLELRKDDRYGIAQDLVTLFRGAAAGAESMKVSVLFSDATATLSNQSVTYTAKEAGTAGNAISITLVDPSGNDEELAVSVAGTDISVSLATDGSGAITTTGTELAEALTQHAAARALVSVSSVAVVALTALAKTSLSGGTDQTKVLKFNVA